MKQPGILMPGASNLPAALGYYFFVAAGGGVAKSPVISSTNRAPLAVNVPEPPLPETYPRV